MVAVADGGEIEDDCWLITTLPFGSVIVWLAGPVTVMERPLIARLLTRTSPETAGPQLATSRTIKKSAVIWLPETVRFRSADDDSLCVSVIPLMALCIVPADSATAPPVTLLGILA